MRQNKLSIISKDVEMHAPKEWFQHILALLLKHAYLWTGKLGNISATTHLIDLVPALAFKSEPHHVGPNTRQLEEFESKRELVSGLIEHCNA